MPLRRFCDACDKPIGTVSTTEHLTWWSAGVFVGGGATSPRENWEICGTCKDKVVRLMKDMPRWDTAGEKITPR